MCTALKCGLLPAQARTRGEPTKTDCTCPTTHCAAAEAKETGLKNARAGRIADLQGLARLPPGIAACCPQGAETPPTIACGQPWTRSNEGPFREPAPWKIPTPSVSKSPHSLTSQALSIQLDVCAAVSKLPCQAAALNGFPLGSNRDIFWHLLASTPSTSDTAQRSPTRCAELCPVVFTTALSVRVPSPVPTV